MKMGIVIGAEEEAEQADEEEEEERAELARSIKVRGLRSKGGRRKEGRKGRKGLLSRWRFGNINMFRTLTYTKGALYLLWSPPSCT